MPIRVFKNTKIPGHYPSQPMKVTASIWNGDSWATDGGRAKIDWSQAPFKAHFEDFNINGCPCDVNNNIEHCSSSKYWWNSRRFWNLNAVEQKLYEYVKKNYLYYDYCSDKARYPLPPPECNL